MDVITNAGGDLRIPTASKEVVIEFPDNVQTAGIVFIPTAAPDHDGFMRLVEWLNMPELFFPFKIHGGSAPMLVNKLNVLSVAAYHDRDSDCYDEVDEARKISVRVDTPHSKYEGKMIVDMPHNKNRALDVLNNNKQFVYLFAAGKEIHVNKRFIVKATEL